MAKRRSGKQFLKRAQSQGAKLENTAKVLPSVSKVAGVWGPHAQLSKRTKEKHFHGPIFGTVWRYQK